VNSPVIAWFRRDLRLTDQPMLNAAIARGGPVIPLFILDPETEALGAAAKWRLGLAVQEFARSLEAIGSRLILRRGAAIGVLQDLMTETKASAVLWSRAYDPVSKARDTDVKSAVRALGANAESFPGFLLHEPWTVETGNGGFYRVYTPYWKSVAVMDVSDCLSAPQKVPAPQTWPASDRLADWHLEAAMNRGASVCAPYQRAGESAAFDRLDRFLEGPVHGYKIERDFPAKKATSGLSENLTYGEIGPRQIWHAGRRAMLEGAAGAEHFLKELVWREFAWHLMHHTPHIATTSWRPEWDNFPWGGDTELVDRWRRGMTGEPFVDAAMREMYVTGKMHNRARMIVASYLTKHMMTHWKLGLDWFADCLTDWDPASNAMGWQWVAGSGPDAAPYFRVFNPAGQADRFDPDVSYRKTWIAELTRHPGAQALSYFDAVPKSWDLDPSRPYPVPMIDLAQGRAQALASYAQRNT
jgi:deoxyribodipyrimidine photo-lyase